MVRLLSQTAEMIPLAPLLDQELRHRIDIVLSTRPLLFQMEENAGFDLLPLFCAVDLFQDEINTGRARSEISHEYGTTRLELTSTAKHYERVTPHA